MTEHQRAASEEGRRWLGHDEVVTISTAMFAAVLLEEGCLVEPAPRGPALTLREAAELLCVLSRTPRLDEPATDHVQLLERSDMLDYAWSNAVRAGIDPGDMSRAHEARRLLLAHHGLR